LGYKCAGGAPLSCTPFHGRTPSPEGGKMKTVIFRCDSCDYSEEYELDDNFADLNIYLEEFDENHWTEQPGCNTLYTDEEYDEL